MATALWALQAKSQNLAKILCAQKKKDRQIRVNAISPGTIPTPGYDQLGFSPAQMDAFLKAQSDATPLGTVGTPDEIASAVLFLGLSLAMCTTRA